MTGFWSPGLAANQGRRGHVRPFTKVRVETDPATVLDIWAELETEAPCSVYQTRRWLLPCIETKAFPAITPIFIVGHDADGRAMVFLPLGISQGAGTRIAHFLGGKHANINMGLFRPGRSWTRSDLRALMVAAARACAFRIDCFALTTQPLAWDGQANPMALLPRQASPSFGNFGVIGPDADAVIEKNFSSHARKTLRKKARRLTAYKGAVRHVVARDDETARTILAAFTRQKIPRLQANGIDSDFDDPGIHAFIARAATERLPDHAPGIELHALYAGDTIVATFGGGGHQGRYSGMFNSFDAEDIEIARSSPGDLLMQEIVKAKCAEDYTSFDLGIGSARYKEGYCNQVEPMFDTIVPITPTGRLIGGVHGLRRLLIGTVKRSPRLWAFATKLRKLRGSRL